MAESPSENDPNNDLKQSIREFVHSQEYLFLCAEDLVKRKQHRQNLTLRNAAKICVRAFRNTANNIACLPETPMHIKREMILTLIEDDDAHRTERFNSIIEEQPFIPAEIDHEPIPLSEDEFDQWVLAARRAHAENLSTDVGRIIGILRNHVAAVSQWN